MTITVSEQAVLKWLQHCEWLYPGQMAQIAAISAALDWAPPELSLDAFRSRYRKATKSKVTLPKRGPKEHPHKVGTTRLGSPSPRTMLSVRIVPFLYGKKASNPARRQAPTHAMFYLLIKECGSNFLWACELTKHIRLSDDAAHIYRFTTQDSDRFCDLIQSHMYRLGLPVGTLYFPTLDPESLNPLDHWAGLSRLHRQHLPGEPVNDEHSEDWMIYFFTRLQGSGTSNWKPRLKSTLIPGSRIKTRVLRETYLSLCCMPERDWQEQAIDVSGDIQSLKALRAWLNSLLDRHNFGEWRERFDSSDLTRAADFAPAIKLCHAYCIQNDLYSDSRRMDSAMRYLISLRTDGAPPDEKNLDELNQFVEVYSPRVSNTQKRRTRPKK